MNGDLPFDANAAMGDLAPLIRAAASGDIEAQRKGRQFALADMKAAMQRGDGLQGQAHAMEAMFWARFAASHGQDEDGLELAAVLSYLAEYWGFDRPGEEYGNHLLAETVNLLDGLAERGSERAADMINHMSRSVAPHIFQRAKEVREFVDVE
jgi:hypothetical protein